MSPPFKKIIKKSTRVPMFLGNLLHQGPSKTPGSLCQVLRLRQFHSSPVFVWMWKQRNFLRFFVAGFFRCGWMEIPNLGGCFFGGEIQAGQAVKLLKFLGVFFLKSVQSWNYTMIKYLPRHWVIWRSIILQGLHFQFLLHLVSMFVDFGIIWHVFIRKIYSLISVRSGNAFFRLGKRIFFGQEFFGLLVTKRTLLVESGFLCLWI